MKYSQREKFVWVKNAALLDKTYMIVENLGQLDQGQQEKFSAGETPKELLAKLNEMTDREYAKEISKAIKSHPAEIRDYCKVRQSLNKATTILLSLGQREVSINEIDRGENETDGITYDLPTGFRVSVKKAELSRIAATGAKGNPDWLINAAIITKADVKKARRRERRPLFDANRIGIVGRFLVDYWCGARGEYGMWINLLKSAKIGNWCGDDGAFVWKKPQPIFFVPPLCFFSNSALSMFCAMALGKKQSDRETSQPAIRKWISRFGLKHASCPKIIEVKTTSEEIYFLTRQ